MRLIPARLPNLHTFHADKAWRKLFSRSDRKKKHSRSKSDATDISLPVSEIPPTFITSAPQTYRPSCSTPSPRASSEYSTADIPAYGDSNCSSPTYSSWRDSITESSTRHSKRFSSVFPARPLSIFSFYQGDDDVGEDFAASSQTSSQAEEQLVLTMTSKYPTGLAAHLYVPEDVSMPDRPGIVRRLSNKVRPHSAHGMSSFSTAPPVPPIPLQYRHNTLVRI